MPDSRELRVELERKLTEVPGVTRGPSRYGHGSAFRTGGREIAHFHGDGRIDLRLTRELIRERVTDHSFDARVRTRGASADWVEVRFSETTDLALIVALVEDAVRANS